jgi:hypothetical protein
MMLQIINILRIPGTPFLQDKAGVCPDIDNEVTIIRQLNRGFNKYFGAFTRLRLFFPL